MSPAEAGIPLAGGTSLAGETRAGSQRAGETREEVVISKRLGPFARLVRLWRFRELVVRLVGTELKVRYKNSVLGFVWSMLNPALTLVVYWLVFTKFLPNGIDHFPIFLMSGLLLWNLFSASIGGATGSVVANAGIVKKVAFPREILPIASVGAGVVHFCLQSVVMLVALLAFRWGVAYSYLWILIPALIALLVFAAALGILLAGINVYLRDTQHLIELTLLAWLWMTPIVYPYMTVATRGDIVATLYKLNPIVWVALAFQRAIYGKVDSVTVIDGARTVTAVLPSDATHWWYVWHLMVVFGISFGILIGALTFFGRVEGNFAEEL